MTTKNLTAIDWLALIRTARQILRQAADILDLPDHENPQAVYAWTHNIVVLADQACKLTPTELDDRAIAWLLDGPLATYENFLPFYSVFQAIIALLRTNADDAQIAARVATLTEAERLADNPLGVKPIELITILVKLFRLILDLAQ